MSKGLDLLDRVQKRNSWICAGLLLCRTGGMLLAYACCKVLLSKCSSELADLVPPRVTVRIVSEQMHRHTLTKV